MNSRLQHSAPPPVRGPFSGHPAPPDHDRRQPHVLLCSGPRCLRLSHGVRDREFHDAEQHKVPFLSGTDERYHWCTVPEHRVQG
ncbi:hypothetical protein DP20_3431 [Shigella flexneri]|nr:hypothetical protein DP20_3431 [Shigella flexneri]